MVTHISREVYPTPLIMPLAQFMHALSFTQCMIELAFLDYLFIFINSIKILILIKNNNIKYYHIN